jgi:hypothetical protein
MADTVKVSAAQMAKHKTRTLESAMLVTKCARDV